MSSALHGFSFPWYLELHKIRFCFPAPPPPPHPYPSSHPYSRSPLRPRKANMNTPFIHNRPPHKRILTIAWWTGTINLTADFCGCSGRTKSRNAFVKHEKSVANFCWCQDCSGIARFHFVFADRRLSFGLLFGYQNNGIGVESCCIVRLRPPSDMICWIAHQGDLVISNLIKVLLFVRIWQWRDRCRV